MSGKPTNFMPMMPPLSVVLPAHLSAQVPLAVMKQAMCNPARTLVEPASREVSSNIYNGVRLSNEDGTAVVFAAKVARRSNTLLARRGISPVADQGNAVGGRNAASGIVDESEVLVQLACVSEETWKLLDDEMLTASMFYAVVPTVVQDLTGLKKSFPPLYQTMLGDPRVLNLMGIADETRDASSGISKFVKNPCFDTFAESVRRALQAGVALFATGQRALPDLPRKIVDAASEVFRKKPEDDVLKVSMTDLDEPQHIQENIVRISESDEIAPMRLDRMRDTVVLFKESGYTGSTYDQLYIVRTQNFMRRLVNWKRAFMIWSIERGGEGGGKIVILMSNWEEARRHRSSHITIRHGLRLLLGERLSFNELMAHEVERGYIRPGENGGFEVFSLSGGTVFSSGHELSDRAVRVHQAFRKELQVDVDFVLD